MSQGSAVGGAHDRPRIPALRMHQRLMSALLAALLLGACSATPRPQTVGQAFGGAATVVASLLVQIVPEQGDAEVFTLRLWSPADRSIRVRVQKLDVAILDALVRPDGAYEALLVRERTATAGRLGAADDPLLLRDLRLLMSELRDGPVPAGVVPDAEGSWDDPVGWRAQVELGQDALPALKVLREGRTEMRRLAYRRWQDFETLRRPSQVELRVHGDPATIRVRVKSLDDPGAISPERMALVIPAEAERVAPGEFERRMPR